MLNRRKLFFPSLLLILFSIQSIAQNSSSSPYSRYGIGDLQFGGFVKNTGMGGTALGYALPFNLNIVNPASYSSLLLTTFETAVSMNQVQLKTDSKKQNINSTSLSYFAFGFPVKNKKWGAGFGLLPYSNVGYSITDPQVDADGLRTVHTYNGSGGLNQFFIGNGYSPFKNFSIGANASYLFGILDQERRVEFPYLSNYFNTRITQQTSVGALYFNFGMQLTFDSLRLEPSDSIKTLDKQLNNLHDSIEVIQTSMKQATPEQRTALETSVRNLNEEYSKAELQKKNVVHRKVKSDWSLTLGLTGSPKTSLRATNSRLVESFAYNSFGEIVVRDTAENIESERGTLVLPLSAGFGVMMRKGSRWLIGTDFSLQNWKDYSIFGESDSLANSWRVSAGVQFTPNERALKSYWKMVQYRFGFHYEQTYLQLRNNQLNDYGISIGLGLPVKRSAAMLHISAEVGKRGTVSDNLIEENYIKVSIGFTLNDRWFVKTKFD